MTMMHTCGHPVDAHGKDGYCRYRRSCDCTGMAPPDLTPLLDRSPMPTPTDDYAPWRHPDNPLARAAYQVTPDWYREPRELEPIPDLTQVRENVMAHVRSDIAFQESVLLRNPRPPVRLFGITTPADFDDSPFRNMVDRWIREQTRHVIVSEEEKLEPLAVAMLFGNRGAHMGVVAWRHTNGIIARAELVDCSIDGHDPRAYPQCITYIQEPPFPDYESYDMPMSDYRRQILGEWAASEPARRTWKDRPRGDENL